MFNVAARGIIIETPHHDVHDDDDDTDTPLFHFQAINRTRLIDSLSAS